MKVFNLMEDIAKNCLKELMQRDSELANCTEQQLSDILALTLNHLPPKYVATVRGEIISKTQLRMQMETDVYRELTNAKHKVLHSSSIRREPEA